VFPATAYSSLPDAGSGAMPRLGGKFPPPDQFNHKILANFILPPSIRRAGGKLPLGWPLVSEYLE